MKSTEPKNKQMQLLLLAKPSASKKRGRQTSIKEGQNLANSVTEDVHGESLQPYYSAETVERIKRRSRPKSGLSKVSKSVWGEL